jgi:hypothetical protein
MEQTRIGIMVLLVGLANLAADISRLMLELTPRRTIIETIQTLPAPQIAPEPAPETQPDIPQKQIEPSIAPTAQGPPRAPPRRPPRQSSEYRPRRQPYSQLPLDYSINNPPWCVVCRRWARR